MEERYICHPTEEALERFLLNHSEEQELETVETHILACESCVSRLETLESDIAASKLGLRQFQAKQAARAASPRRNQWLTVPKLSWFSAAAAALAVALFVFVPRNADLTSYRGLENPVLPSGHPLHLHLNATDLPEGPVTIEIVDAQGARTWTGSATIRQDRVDLVVPSIRAQGSHFLRIYARAQANSDRELLREFAFKTK